MLGFHEVNVHFTEENEMIELIKKAFLTGVGIAALTKDKVEELTNELIDKGKMSEQEGEKLVKDMLNQAEESRETLKSQIDSLVKNTIAKMHVARIEDIELLKNEIQQLRDEIAALSKESKKEDQ